MLPAEIKQALPAVIQHCRSLLAPAADEALNEMLVATVALTGFHGSEAAKGEWIAAAIVRLQDLPADLVFEGLAEAQRTVRSAQAVLPAVFAYAESYPARRRERLSKLLVLSDAIG